MAKRCISALRVADIGRRRSRPGRRGCCPGRRGSRARATRLSSPRPSRPGRRGSRARSAPVTRGQSSARQASQSPRPMPRAPPLRCSRSWRPRRHDRQGRRGRYAADPADNRPRRAARNPTPRPSEAEWAIWRRSRGQSPTPAHPQPDATTVKGGVGDMPPIPRTIAHVTIASASAGVRTAGPAEPQPPQNHSPSEPQFCRNRVVPLNRSPVRTAQPPEPEPCQNRSARQHVSPGRT